MKTLFVAATDASSFADKAVIVLILVPTVIFLFWFLWPSSEDDAPFASTEGDYDDDDDEDDDPCVDHGTVFDKIVPSLTCDSSPLSDVIRSDGDAIITFRANETLRDVTHFIQAVLDGAGYTNSFSTSQMSQTATFEISRPVGFELTVMQSATEKGLFVLAFEYD